MTWYLLKIPTTREFSTEKALENHGFTPYLPKMPVDKRELMDVDKPFEPMFPGYIFIDLVAGQDDFNEVKKVSGGYFIMVHLFGGKTPAIVRDDLLDEIRLSEAALNHAPDIYDYSPGEVVRVKPGPFEGYIGEILALNGKDRVFVLVEGIKYDVRRADIAPESAA